MKLTQDDMAAAAEGVIEIAGLYDEGIGVLANEVSTQVEKAFDTEASSPKIAWQDYCNAIWSVLADSQDNVNLAAENLAQYTYDMFDVDGENAETLKKAGDLEGADHPKEGQ